jgi:hypothetical protein
MTKRIFSSIFLAFTLLLSIAIPALAQDYSFEVPEVEVNVYLESDGTAAIEYNYLFRNAAGAHVIDFVDVGMPGASSYNLSDITASINGNPITDISSSPYVDGVALGLGGNAIQPGDTGIVYMYAENVRDVFYFASSDKGEDYASVNFQPNYFESGFWRRQATLRSIFRLAQWMAKWSGIRPKVGRVMKHLRQVLTRKTASFTNGQVKQPGPMVFTPSALPSRRA